MLVNILNIKIQMMFMFIRLADKDLIDPSFAIIKYETLKIVSMTCETVLRANLTIMIFFLHRIQQHRLENC